MRKLFLIFGLLVLCAGTADAKNKENLDLLWDRANNHYVNADYKKAIVLYDSILTEGYASSKLYYNLGNAHFKNNNIGKAVLNYNKALRLSPYDKDIEYNLSVANSYVKDRIDTVPEFVVNRWAKAARTQLSSDQWAIISLVVLALVLAAILLYLLADKRYLRKAGFYSAIVLVVLYLITTSFSAKAHKEINDSSYAIVMSNSAAVKSSPDNNSGDIFILHEGTKVKVIGAYNSWNEIQIADGNKGWMRSGAIELID